MTARKVLVLGAAGFLGRHLSAAFCAAGDTVLRVCKAAPPRLEPGIGDGAGSARWVALDLVAAAEPRLAEFVAAHRPDVVVNAAGTVWQADDRRMTELNDVFVGRLVRVLRSLPRAPRLVQLGSVHEYGPVPVGVDLTEQSVPAPAGCYGRTKLRGSRWVLDGAAEGLDAVVLRIANACGPGMPPESLLGRVAAHLVRQAAEPGAPAPLRLTPLRARRDFVDVRDVAAAVLAAADAPRSSVAGRVVNVARGEAVPVRDLVDRLIALSGLPVRVVEEAGAGAVRSDAGWQRVDIRLAGVLLGWKPERGLDETLRDVIAFAGTRPAGSQSAER
jgi:nucleoside-diphosphate-sugar epimerase